MASEEIEEDYDREGLPGLAELGREKHHARKSEDISELISVAEFKRKWTEQDDVFNDPLQGAGPEEIRGQLGLSLAEFASLQETCDMDHLLPPKGIEPILKLKVADLPAKESPLQTIKQSWERWSNPSAYRRHPTLLKEILERKGMSMNALMAIPQQPSNGTPVKLPEVIISVVVFHPFKKRKDQEFLVLGSQSLCVLRDKILCCNDYIIAKDYSVDPNGFDRKAMDQGPPNRSNSAFFFINNTFYNDRRHPMSSDLSKAIIDWAESENRAELSLQLDHFQTADMESTTFEQLYFRIGYPYVYRHHSNCEHLIIFSDIRMLHLTDCQSVEDYPHLIFKHRPRQKKCHVCSIFGPSWVTRNDEFATENPCYFCEDCFRKLHYSPDGKKVCNFEAYPFHSGFII